MSHKLTHVFKAQCLRIQLFCAIVFFLWGGSIAYDLDAARDSLQLYFQKIENAGITKEKIEFNGLYNRDTVIKKIETIKKSYKNSNYELCWYYFTEEVSQYYYQLLSYDLYHKCISHDLPKVKNEELFTCGNEDPENLLKMKFNHQNRCKLYLLYLGLVRTQNRGAHYDTLISKTKHDPFISYYITYHDSIGESAYQKNVFTNNDDILRNLNTMEQMYKERFYKLADLEVGKLESALINKYRAYIYFWNENPSDKRVDSLKSMITSAPVNEFVKDYFRYAEGSGEGDMMKKIRKYIQINRKE